MGGVHAHLQLAVPARISCLRYEIAVTGSMASKRDPLPVGESRGKILNAIVESLAKSYESENWGLMMEAAEDYQK